MRRTRLLFSKTGRAKYISHLDLMRTFQRVFMRSGVFLRHTEGFNPHPYLNFALPLSVGCESDCELLDFDLADDTNLDMLPSKLNETMPEGIKAIKAYEPDTKFSDITWLEIVGSLFYDQGVYDTRVSELTSLFNIKGLIISKKSKKGFVETDISPLIQRIEFSAAEQDRISMHAIIKAQNPSLNPEYLITAVKTHQPSNTPDFSAFRRIEVYKGDLKIFR